MTVTWRNILAIVFVAVALMLLAAVPAANPPKELGFFEMEDATELIVADTTDALDAYVAIPAPDRPSDAFVVECGRASISTLQRHLKVGYNRACHLMEALEANEVVSKAGHDGRREVLINYEGEALA